MFLILKVQDIHFGLILFLLCSTLFSVLGIKLRVLPLQSKRSSTELSHSVLASLTKGLTMQPTFGLTLMPSASACQVLGLQIHAAMPSCDSFYLYIHMCMYAYSLLGLTEQLNE